MRTLLLLNSVTKAIAQPHCPLTLAQGGAVAETSMRGGRGGHLALSFSFLSPH